MKTGITFGAFDLLHTGHLLMLKEAKEHCDTLIVGLHINPKKERKDKNEPIESVFERYIRLKSCKYVDGIIPYETEDELITILEMVKPDIRFLDVNYKDKEYTGHYLNIPVHYNERNHGYSSTNLRERVCKSQ
jgi:glycerol-3-phosphate cytidylyltransferase